MDFKISKTTGISIVFLLFASLLFGQKTIQIQQNCVAEWSYFSNIKHNNPFRDVILDLKVKSPSGLEMTIPAFWVGKNEWRFRFSANEPGTYRFVTLCNDKKDKSLNQQKGTIIVSEYSGDNQLYKHGGLKISSDKRHFEQADGKPFFWLADEWWHGMVTRFKWPEDLKTLTADRKEKGFSVIGFAIGFPCDIKPFDTRGQNENGDPWIDSTFMSINPAYFDLTDKRIQYLVEEGLVPNIVGSWGYYLKWSGIENMKLYYRYLIARYAAYPITWTLAGEVTLPYYDDTSNGEGNKFKAQQRKDWSEVGRYLQANEPYNRLVTVHPGPGIWDGKPPLDDMSVLDFIFLQSGHSGFHTLPRAIEQVKENLKLYSDKPVLHGEVCFEGMQGSSWEDIQRFLFWSNILSGTAGYSYGSEGIWQFNTKSQLFGASPAGNVWGNVTWDVCMNYSGSKQVGIGKKILEKVDWWKLESHPEWIESKDTSNIFSYYCAGIEDKLHLIYLYQKPSKFNPYIVTHLKSNTIYNYQFIDPITGEFYPEKTLTTDSNGKWKVPLTPIMQDFVLKISN